MDDPPVFVIDLREPLEADAPGHAASSGTTERLSRVAIIDDRGAVELHRVEPTDDLAYLNALARLLRFAHAHALGVRTVAERYGSEYERRLLFEKRLPAWALDWPDRG